MKRERARRVALDTKSGFEPSTQPLFHMRVYIIPSASFQLMRTGGALQRTASSACGPVSADGELCEPTATTLRGGSLSRISKISNREEYLWNKKQKKKETRALAS